MTYNMNLLRNSNARGNVLDKFNACKEYVRFETDALLITLALTYFGMDKLDMKQEDVIPPSILSGSTKIKHDWLCKHIETILTKYVIDPQSKETAVIAEGLNDSRQQTNSFPCRFPGCSRVYRYVHI